MRISDWSSDVCSSDLLKQAGEEASAPTGGHQGHGSHANHELMRGMATSDELAELAAANGTAFDRQFITLMLEHHRGAITMVDRKSDDEGKSLSVRVDLGGCCSVKNKTSIQTKI